MSTVPATSRIAGSNTRKAPNATARLLWLAAILIVAAFFVGKYVFRYYLNYNEAAFELGAPNYWVQRGWLLMHITGGMVAVLTGPFQF